MTFDPYQQWLQIPSSRQPPSYYDLLGIAEDEIDTQRIHEAAAGRYEHVRKYVLGPQGQLADRILVELSKAVACLTDRERRQQYDQQRLGEPVDAVLAEADERAPGVSLWGDATGDGDRPPELPSTRDGSPRPSVVRRLPRLAVMALAAPFLAVDFFLRTISGKDNAILHNFLRGLTVLAMAGTVAGAIAMLLDPDRRRPPSPESNEPEVQAAPVSVSNATEFNASGQDPAADVPLEPVQEPLTSLPPEPEPSEPPPIPEPAVLEPIMSEPITP